MDLEKKRLLNSFGISEEDLEMIITRGNAQYGEGNFVFYLSRNGHDKGRNYNVVYVYREKRN